MQCFYIDRPWRPSPLKQKTKQCRTEEFLDVLSAEIDKNFFGIEFVCDEECLSSDKFIEQSLQNKRKIRFLILVDDGYTLKTRFMNRTHRVINLEITRNISAAVVSRCNYCDKNYKDDRNDVVPSGLVTIQFDYSLDAVLKIANNELNGDFTDVITTADTFNFDKSNLPICGRI